MKHPSRRAVLQELNERGTITYSIEKYGQGGSTVTRDEYLLALAVQSQRSAVPTRAEFAAALKQHEARVLDATFCAEVAGELIDQATREKLLAMYDALAARSAAPSPAVSLVVAADVTDEEAQRFMDWLVSAFDCSYTKEQGKAIRRALTDFLNNRRAAPSVTPEGDDAERLNWLDAQRDDIIDDRTAPDGDVEQVLLGHGWYVRGQCETVREAIDAERLSARAGAVGSSR